MHTPANVSSSYAEHYSCLRRAPVHVQRIFYTAYILPHSATQLLNNKSRDKDPERDKDGVSRIHSRASPRRYNSSCTGVRAQLPDFGEEGAGSDSVACEEACWCFPWGVSLLFLLPLRSVSPGSRGGVGGMERGRGEGEGEGEIWMDGERLMWE